MISQQIGWRVGVEVIGLYNHKKIPSRITLTFILRSDDALLFYLFIFSDDAILNSQLS